MSAESGQERFAPDAPFRFVGGDCSLDFINTADWTDRGIESDRFTSYQRLIEWARGADIASASDARRLAHFAASHPRRAAVAYEAAITSRFTLHELFASVVEELPRVRVLEQFNELHSEAAAKLQLARGEGARLVRSWAGYAESPESILWPVIWSAGELLVSTDADRLRRCAGRDCGWMYVDRSRNGLRRWCEMSVCGTVEKNRRRAERA